VVITERLLTRKDGTLVPIVILDLTVPGGGGGREAVEQILEIDPEARVIVSSGYAEDPVIAKHGEYGFKAVVIKPYTYQDLYEKVSYVMEHK
jgi:DNA-binding NarL/FixJ family response regulator